MFNFVHKDGRPKYWRDIGTRDAYYEANLALLGRNPEFDLYDRNWPVRTSNEQYPPNKIINSSSRQGVVVDSLLSGGCVVEGAHVERSVLSPSVKIYEGAEVRNSVIMHGVTIGAGAKIKDTIIDKEVVVPDGASIGYDSEYDRKRFVLTTSGIVIVPKRAKVPK